MADTTFPDIAGEPQESETVGRLFPRESWVRPDPKAHERTEAVDGLLVDLALSIALLVPGVLTGTMRDRSL